MIRSSLTWTNERVLLAQNFQWNFWEEALSFSLGMLSWEVEVWAAGNCLPLGGEKPENETNAEEIRAQRRMMTSEIQLQRLSIQQCLKLITPFNSPVK